MLGKMRNLHLEHLKKQLDLLFLPWKAIKKQMLRFSCTSKLQFYLINSFIRFNDDVDLGLLIRQAFTQSDGSDFKFALKSDGIADRVNDIIETYLITYWFYFAWFIGFVDILWSSTTTYPSWSNCSTSYIFASWSQIWNAHLAGKNETLKLSRVRSILVCKIHKVVKWWFNLVKL